MIEVIWAFFRKLRPQRDKSMLISKTSMQNTQSMQALYIRSARNPHNFKVRLIPIFRTPKITIIATSSRIQTFRTDRITIHESDLIRIYKWTLKNWHLHGNRGSSSNSVHTKYGRYIPLKMIADAAPITPKKGP